VRKKLLLPTGILIAIISAFIFLTPRASSQGDMSKQKLNQVNASAPTEPNLFNSRFALQVNGASGSVGRFNLGAFPDATGGRGANSWNLMYRWPGTPTTSFTSLRIDGADSRYGTNGTLVEAPTDINATTNRSKWRIGEIEITQTIQIATNSQTNEQDVAKISYAVTNTGTVSHSTGVRMMIDTDINYNDGAPFRIPGTGLVTTEQEFSGAAIPDFFQVFFNISDNTHVAAATLRGGEATVPDRLVLARWPGIQTTTWDYTVTPGSSITSDSAYALYWNPTPLAPNASRTYTTFYGIGDIQVDLQPPLALGLTSPATLSVVNDQYSPNPFDVLATVLNNGTVTATNVQLAISLPNGLTLTSGTATQTVGDMPAGQERQVSWRVHANPQDNNNILTYSVTATANNAAAKVLQKPLALKPLCNEFLNMDSDQDGLCDCWERNGIDSNGDGTIDLTLSVANPNHKDIYVEIDYMEDNTHSHRPNPLALASVAVAFNAAPVSNPDSVSGIRLHYILDEAIPDSDKVNFPEYTASQCPNTNFDTLKHAYFGTAAEHDNANSNKPNIIAAKQKAFRYAVFAHRYSTLKSDNSSCEDGSSGIARVPSNSPPGTPGRDFLVTLAPFFANRAAYKSRYCFPGETDAECGQREIEAGTFMHELGHTLGLRHGGNENVNCKPNYLSLMSYALQFPNLDPTRPLDYSQQELDPLNEDGGLNENDGVVGPPDRNVVYGTPTTILDIRCRLNGYGYCGRKSPTNGSINWDRSLNPFASSINVSANINRIDSAGCSGEGREGENEPRLSTLNGFDDWQHLTYRVPALPTAPNSFSLLDTPEPELTAENAFATADSTDFDDDGVSNAQDNCPAVFNPDQADSDGNGIGNVCQLSATSTLADLALTNTIGQNPAIIGGTTTYSLTVTNRGPNDATSVVVTDSLPPQTAFVSCSASPGGACGGTGNNRTVTFASLSNGATATATLTIAIFSNVTDGEIVTNQASVIASPTLDLNSVNNTAVAKAVALRTNTNPLEAAQFFVRQHYYDFLSREPDTGGLNYWTNEIAVCGQDEQCLRSRRIGVSAAFFIELEFQDTGAFIYRFYKSSLGRRLKFDEFLSDRGQVVGGPSLEQSKQTFTLGWVQRPEFSTKYPASQTAGEFVDALLATVQQTSNVNLTGMRQAFINEYNAQPDATHGRARVVRLVSDAPALQQAEGNQAFVLMQYFGYLRRNVDEGGYQFWLNILNQQPGRFREMVCAFITSAEYQLRFGSQTPHSNAECGGNP
jgi:uncharacterized repeat protein (TIGR01451 family)